MAQKPVLYPGAVLSRNSQMRQAALQGGAYSAAASAAPSTLGMFGPDYSSALFNNAPNPESWALFAGRVRNYLEDDKVVAYSFTWNNVFIGVGSNMYQQVALYTVDMDRKTATIVPGSLAKNTYAVTGSVERTELLTLPTPVAIPKDSVVIAAVWLKMTYADYSSVSIRGVGPGGTLGLSVALRSTNGASLEQGMTDQFVFGTGQEIDPRNVIPGIAVLTARNQFDTTGFLL